MGSRAWVSDGEQLRYNRLPLASIRKGILRYGNTVKDITKIVLNSTSYDFEKQAKEGVVVLGKGYSAATFFLPEVTTVLPETSGEIAYGNDGGDTIHTYMPLIPGAIYRVIHNDTVYQCKAYSVYLSGVRFNFLGNGKIIMGNGSDESGATFEDTGEPFVLVSCYQLDNKMASGIFGSTGPYTVKVEKLERKATIPTEGAEVISLKEYLYNLVYTPYSEIPAWDEFAKNVARVFNENQSAISNTIGIEFQHEDSSRYNFSWSVNKEVISTIASAKGFFKMIYDGIPDDSNNTMLSEWILEDGAVYAVMKIKYSSLLGLNLILPLILGRP